MRPLWTVAEVVKATGGHPEGLSDGPISSISIDSREIAHEALFVAIKGEVHDGHDFVGKALEAGASAALVSEDHFKAHGGKQVIVVPDTLKALEALGIAARARNRGQIIAVTGSAGKTSTKEAIRTVLAAFGETHYSIKSFNNHWGVPLMLARLPREAQFGVFEVGMNHAGEITPLVKMVRPHIAVITTVAAAHLEFFNSVAEIAEAKAEIFLGLEPGGTAVLNGDHEYLHILFAQARAAGVSNVVIYGYDESADWHIDQVGSSGTSTTADVSHEGETYHLNLQVPGRHMVANAVAALVVAQISGEGTKPAIAALAKFGAPEGRGLTLRLGPEKKPLLLVDESYNANVASMTAAMDLYAGVTPPDGRKLLVLGDMLEMGPQGPVLHAGLAGAVLNTGAAEVFLVGEAMRSLADELRRKAESDRDAPAVTHMTTAEEIADTVLSALAYGDAVMVKGSKGVRLSPLVQKIRERFQNA
ncbi:UDP-N-acetylmuramoyl-tripeptide--D-alanyl-D-alanine ligase [Devosia sp. ZB163]|uniref:UDP-N-acetylmuramoyl-tripeptide--D-alanyl-D- alanine ligase n=1 Tax=Devosia sp. ZB163 TaxID=3025938 RepID=UPI002362CDDA|nr:UDP-N-acetylmuramoyl-tripeptide--D-alanyl-D-alanine ligase [Devosia sp. ZB163]MDC9825928.1 UDP-N-acetylmuramoyl-tripeptide--D-alanyl-D-alanine ligase [Devosia sp. ZB163]